MPVFETYHGVPASEHQNRFNSLLAQGYRIISLSVYGDPSSASYAAVWIKGGGPAWEAAHGLSASQYQDFFNKWKAKGYYPLIVSATGSGNAVFATVWQQGNPGPWKARHGINEATFQSECFSAIAADQIPVSVSIYGNDSNRLYAAIWLTDNSGAEWNFHSSDSASSYQTWFDAVRQVPLRPAYVALSATQTYVSVFRGDGIGPWQARHGLTSDQYQAEFDAQKKNGLFPICVQGGGSDGSTRYAAIFAQQDTPVERVWKVTGNPVPSLAQFDNAMKNVMQSRGVRAAALTIAKNGVVHLSRGYTWAEPGYAITQPNTVFRLASVSKAFTSAAIYTLIQAGKVSQGDKVFPMLGITPFNPLPGQPPDPRYNNITVGDCINHLGGWDATLAKFDPVFASRTIAAAMGLNTFDSKKQMASYMMGRQPLQFTPGTQPDLKDAFGNPRGPYSNFGYVMLGLVVEHASNKQFIDYVQQDVLKALNVSDVFLAATLMAHRRANEALAESPNISLTALDPNSNQSLPSAYGGFVLETMDSGGGLIASVPSLAALVQHYAAWGVGLRSPGSARTGAEEGTRTRIGSRANGIDYGFAFNTRWNIEGAVDNKGTAYIDQFGSTLEAMLDGLNL